MNETPPSHPIFIVGAPRTGTTLLKDILNRHPAVRIFDEVHFFERLWDDREAIGDLEDAAARARAFERLRGIVRGVGGDAPVADILPDEEFQRRLDAEGGGYPGLLRALLRAGAGLHGATVWGDSSPQDVLYLDLIREWYPDARIVGVVRDPRGFLASAKNYYRRGLATYHERYNPLTNSLLWRSYMTALQTARGHEAVHLVHYEQLVDRPEETVRALCGHVRIPFDPSLLEVEASNTSFAPVEEAAAEPPRGIVASSRDRWRTELTPTELWLGERIFGAVMETLGYERAARPGPWPPSVPELAGILALLPGRLYNMLFRVKKPFRMGKVKRVLGMVRRR